MSAPFAYGDVGVCSREILPGIGYVCVDVRGCMCVRVCLCACVCVCVCARDVRERVSVFHNTEMGSHN